MMFSLRWSCPLMGIVKYLHVIPASAEMTRDPEQPAEICRLSACLLLPAG
jgi:hypothetical protein